MRRFLPALFCAALAAAPVAACNRQPPPAAQDRIKAEGEAFLKENATKEGVQTTPSGLQYKVNRSGPEGGAHPRMGDLVKVHYHGQLLDGTVFDSSYDRGVPASFGLQGIIPGWVEALQLMRPGDDWEVWLPSDLGYGERGAPPDIRPNSVLHFRIELLDIYSPLGAPSAR